VYSPELLIVPTVEFPALTLLTLHVTAELDVPDTLAVNCCVSPRRTLKLEPDGEIDKETTGGAADDPPPPPQLSVAIASPTRQNKKQTPKYRRCLSKLVRQYLLSSLI
jgi:hypothetical protein